MHKVRIHSNGTGDVPSTKERQHRGLHTLPKTGGKFLRRTNHKSKITKTRSKLKMKRYLLPLGAAFGAISLQAEETSSDLVTETTGKLTTLADNAETLFNKVVPVVLAAVSIGVLVAIIKFIKKR